MPAANAAISSKATTVAISTTAGGTYTIIAYVHTYSSRRGTANEENIYFYGSSTPITDTTSAEQTISINFLLNLGDTNGQNLLRSAAEAGTQLWVRLLPDGANGVQRQVTIRNYQEDGDANGTGINRFVRGACDLVGSGPVTVVASA